MDLGLPSGTLWLDRLIGAQSPHDPGLFYQWGAIVGHDSADGYAFTPENYEAQGLNLIRTDLDDAHDAARAYYGPMAKMPTNTQYQELIDNCVISVSDDGLMIITSNINGLSIVTRPNGYIVNTQIRSESALYAWSNIRVSNESANSLHITAEQGLYMSSNARFCGLNVMAVHS